MSVPSRRAPAMPVDDRRAALVEAVIPLLLQHGSDVTTKQIAEAAGVAEGTIFRAFPDKESLISAAVDRYLEPDEVRVRLEGIDPTLPLEEKVHHLVALMLDRFDGVIRVMAARGYPTRRPRDEVWPFTQPIATLLEPDLDRLALAPERVAHYIRLVAFSSAIPHFTRDMGFTVDELTRLILGGIVRPPHPDSHPAPTPQRG